MYYLNKESLKSSYFLFKTDYSTSEWSISKKGPAVNLCPDKYFKKRKKFLKSWKLEKSSFQKWKNNTWNKMVQQLSWNFHPFPVSREKKPKVIDDFCRLKTLISVSESSSLARPQVDQKFGKWKKFFI